jgi:broad specificity phosphatase PhoE
VLRYITHPDVKIDAAVPVPQWHLNDRGRTRLWQMLEQPWVSSIGRVISSPETKALDAAGILAEHLGLTVEVRDSTGELDRSSTGFVSHERHEQLADELFTFPDRSAAGWERALDAQRRIVAALADLLVDENDASTAVVGHGGVGTLWYCSLSGQRIDRRHDQPGQGHYFTVDVATRTVMQPWRAIDDLEQP